MPIPPQARERDRSRRRQLAGIDEPKALPPHEGIDAFYYTHAHTVAG